MANFLDKHRDIVEGYKFNSIKIDKLFFNDQRTSGIVRDTYMYDLSDFNKFTLNLYS